VDWLEKLKSIRLDKETEICYNEVKISEKDESKTPQRLSEEII
jgi:hypothetical protein